MSTASALMTSRLSSVRSNRKQSSRPQPFVGFLDIYAAKEGGMYLAPRGQRLHLAGRAERRPGISSMSTVYLGGTNHVKDSRSEAKQCPRLVFLFCSGWVLDELLHQRKLCGRISPGAWIFQRQALGYSNAGVLRSVQRKAIPFIMPQKE